MPCNANAIGWLLVEFGSLHQTIGMAVDDILNGTWRLRTGTVPDVKENSSFGTFSLAV